MLQTDKFQTDMGLQLKWDSVSVHCLPAVSQVVMEKDERSYHLTFRYVVSYGISFGLDVCLGLCLSLDCVSSCLVFCWLGKGT